MEKLTSASSAARNFDGDRPPVRFALPFFRWCVVVRFCERRPVFVALFLPQARARARQRGFSVNGRAFHNPEKGIVRNNTRLPSLCSLLASPSPRKIFTLPFGHGSQLENALSP